VSFSSTSHSGWFWHWCYMIRGQALLPASYWCSLLHLLACLALVPHQQLINSDQATHQFPSGTLLTPECLPLSFLRLPVTSSGAFVPDSHFLVSSIIGCFLYNLAGLIWFVTILLEHFSLGFAKWIKFQLLTSDILMTSSYLPHLHSARCKHKISVWSLYFLFCCHTYNQKLLTYWTGIHCSVILVWFAAYFKQIAMLSP